MSDATTAGAPKAVAKIAVIGAGWWSQGWHLPCLDRNPQAQIIAIIDTSSHPKSSLNPNLESLENLQARYQAPVYHSVDEFLQDTKVSSELDGVLIATPHATHYDVARKFLCLGASSTSSFSDQQESSSPSSNADVDHPQRRKPVHILMEKPMTTNIQHALDLFQLVRHTTTMDEKDSHNSTSSSTPSTSSQLERGSFWVNHSANFRSQTKLARDTIVSGTIGRVRHITAFLGSPLSWIFDDPTNTGWNEPTEGMLGNGFAWGQSSHLLAWIYHVCPMVRPIEVYCSMIHSETTEADVSHSATIRCCSSTDVTTTPDEPEGGITASYNTTKQPPADIVVLSLSGTTLLPGNAHSHPPVAKEVQIEIFGSHGCIFYRGNDRDPTSGRLELRHADGSIQVLHDQFDFENLDNEGFGPESLQNFVQLCHGSGRGGDDNTATGGGGVYAGANVMDGLRSVQTIDAMYRSNASGQPEKVLHPPN
jgi:predicted dehydrogenase